MVVAFCGLPGSGKSTLARLLASDTGWQRLDRDLLRHELFADDGGYSQEDKHRLAAEMLERLRMLLVAGESVIVDGMTFSRHAERDAFSQLATGLDARWLLAWVDCDVSTAKTRIRRDALHPAADRNPGLVDEVAARFETPDDALCIDGSLDHATQLQLLLTAIHRCIQET